MEFIRRLFKREQVVEEEYQYCDGCGQDYPTAHLTYINFWDGDFCSTCIQGSDVE